MNDDQVKSPVTSGVPKPPPNPVASGVPKPVKCKRHAKRVTSGLEFVDKWAALGDSYAAGELFIFVPHCEVSANHV